ncbi:unknown protein [Desulfotalea psychrophila LSv54]|uniref:DUF945 family protein n=2 Tax=Desulfotalea psychrophila TaxID=84980 RepID=Q6APC4_DESPS|nr:unknown protein [Desulfotalea psychrophila LSv54]
MLSNSQEGVGMKKIMVGFVALLVVAGVCAPFINGLVMEKMVTQSQDDLNKMYVDTGSDMAVEVIKYDRKFSSSEIEWKIKLGSLAAIYGVDEIIFVDRADHGFTGVVSKTSLEKNRWFVDLLDDKFDGKNPLTITTTYRLGRKIESVIDIGSFTLQLGNESVASLPGRIVSEYDVGLTHWISEATWAGFSVPGKVSMGGFSLGCDLEKISTYIWDGDLSYEIKDIKVEGKKGNFELVNFAVQYTLGYDKNKNMLSMGGEIEIASIAVANQKVKDAVIKLAINNIDAQSYEEFMKIYTQTIASTLDDISLKKESSEGMDEALKQEMATAGIQMMAACEKFLKKGLELKISDLHVQLPEGRISGNAGLILNKDVTFAQLAPIVIQPNLAFDIFSLQSDFSIPAELISDKSKLVSPVFPGMQTGLFVIDGENLVHRTQTKNGKLLLNGNEMLFH